MKEIKPISSLMVGIVSAAIYGGATLLCGPAILFLLTAGSVPRLDADPIDGWVTLGVFAPLLGSAIGFLAGFFMASIFNFFARQTHRPAPAVVVVIRRQRRGAAAGQSHIAAFPEACSTAVRAQENVMNG